MISESTPPVGSTGPAYKFIVNSTIVQHLVPTAQMNKSRGTGPTSEDATVTTSSEADKVAAATATDGKPHVGRRGINSSSGAYWNEKTDGMWTYKYDGGETKGMDIIIHLVWIGL